jgi:hypothetical protein
LRIDIEASIHVEERGGFSSICDTQQALVFHAPLGVRADDWFLFMMCEFGTAEDRVGIIARESEEGKWTIIGPTLCPVDVPWNMPYRSAERFISHWDSEDALVFGWRFAQLPHEGASDDETRDFVNMRICGSRDSSYFTRGIIPMESP